MTDRQRHRDHAKWLSWQQGDRKGPQPPPGYKDCANCELREEYDTQEERAEFCATQCPWDDLPVAPGERFLMAAYWSRLPEAIIAKHESEIGIAMLFEIQSMREERMSPLG